MYKKAKSHCIAMQKGVMGKEREVILKPTENKELAYMNVALS